MGETLLEHRIEARRSWLACASLTAVGGVLLGGLVGVMLAAEVTRATGVARTFVEAVALSSWLATAYGAAAIVPALLATRRRLLPLRSVAAGVVIAAIACLAFWIFETVVGAAWWWPETGRPRTLLSFGAAAAIAAVARFVLELRAFRERLTPLGLVVLGTAAALAVRAWSGAMPARPSSQAFAAIEPTLPAAARDRRVILLGIDGASWERIDALTAQGRLPSFERLQQRGVRADLATLHPTWSPIVWTTIATGRFESEHGVHDFTEVIVPGLERGIQRTYAKLEEDALLPRGVGLVPLLRELTLAGWLDELPISSRHRRVKALWNVLGERGATVGVVSWFATFPAESVRGWMVSDNDPWRQQENGSPLGVGLTYPRELLAELSRALPPISDEEHLTGHRSFATPIYRSLTDGDRANIARWPGLLPTAHGILGGDRFAGETGLWLWRAKEPQFLAVYLKAVDNLSHRWRQYTGVVDHTYEWTDAMLGRYLDLVDERTTLIVVSDHGWTYEPDHPVGHNHAPDGVLLMVGAGVNHDVAWTSKPSILDVAPTVLALFGLPASHSMPGRAWREAFDAAHLGAEVPPIATWGAYEPTWPAGATGSTEQALQNEGLQRLKALGYAE